MSSLTMSQRRLKIKEIAATDYQLKSDQAKDYLVALEGSTIEEQRELFALIIKIHGILRPEKKCHKFKDSMSEKEWESSVERVSNNIDSLSRAVLRNNSTLDETAAFLWDNITLYEGNDRIVALALLLSGEAVPYVQISNNLTMALPQTIYEQAYDRITESIAAVMRLERSSLTVLELSSALSRLMKDMDTEERTVLLSFILGIAREKIQKGEVALVILNSIGPSLKKILPPGFDQL